VDQVIASDPFLRKVRKRGQLIVGVSSDTRLLGARNPTTLDLEGFDIDIAQQVAKRLFGSQDAIEYRVIRAADRVPLLQNGTVDLVARAFTINCERWKQVAFSSEYLHAGQKVLVRLATDPKQQVTSIQGLPKGSRVCATLSSTSIDRIKGFDGLVAVGAPLSTDCLALFQQGKVEAITSDDAILAGLAAQDPYATVPKGQKAFSDEPYGLGIAKENKAFVSVVNAVLDQVRASGQWEQFYQSSGLESALGPKTPPTPLYGRQ
jgi:polar amino acid transport system substrate-binding protein